MTSIYAESWLPSIQVVSLIEFVRSIKKQGLLSAKRDVETFLDGNPLLLEISASDEKDVRNKLKELGVLVRD